MCGATEEGIKDSLIRQGMQTKKWLAESAKVSQVAMGLDLQPDGLTAGLAASCPAVQWTLPVRQQNIHSLRKKKKRFVCLLQEKHFHILISDVVKIKSACVSIVSPTGTIRKLFFESPSQVAHF